MAEGRTDPRHTTEEIEERNRSGRRGTWGLRARPEKNKMNHNPVRLAIAGLLLIGASLPARAAPDEQCIPYAAAAVAAATSAAANHCGFTGERWSTTHTDHMKWCQTADPAALAAEAAARNQELQGCIAARSAAPNSPERERCTDYAATAVDQQRQNLNRQCGFSGDAWNANWQEHFAWCSGVPAAEAKARTETRTRQLAENCVEEVCTSHREWTIKPPFFRTIRECKTVPKAAR